jgi:hypothetical protein
MMGYGFWGHGGTTHKKFWKVALHHAVSKSTTRTDVLLKSCSEGMINPVNAVTTRVTTAR